MEEILIHYIKSGLENNEFCIWVTSTHFRVEEAKDTLKRTVPNIEVYLKKGQIEITPYTQLYAIEDIFDSNRMLKWSIEKLYQALANGYAGLRLTGDSSRFEKKDWSDFVDYGGKVGKVRDNYKIIALCTYFLENYNALEIINAANNHQFVLVKKEGKWELIESSKRKITLDALQRKELQFNDIVNSIQDGFFELGKEWRFIYINKSAAKNVGFEPEELIGEVYGKNSPGKSIPNMRLHSEIS